MTFPLPARLALTALLALLVLLVAGCGTPPDAADASVVDPTPKAAAATPVTPVAPPATPGSDPLAGTSWRSVMAIGDVPAVGREIVFVFKSDGRVIISSRHPDGAAIEETRLYSMKGREMTLVNDLGQTTKSEVKIFGDEMTINAPKAMIRLRRLESGDSTAPAAAPAGGTEMHPEHPLRGTGWSIVRMMGNVPTTYRTGQFDFREDGRLVMTFDRLNGTSNTVVREYRAIGPEIVLTDDLGQEAAGTLELKIDRLRIDMPTVRVDLKREW